MRAIIGAILILIYVLDLVCCFFFFIIQDLGIELFLIVHLFLSIVSIFLTMMRKKSGFLLPSYLVFLPGAGAFMILILILMKRFISHNKEFLAEFESHIAYVHENIGIKSEEVEKTMNYMNILDVFSHMDSERKKEAIVDALDDEIPINMEALKNGFFDNDPEVVHYTASTIKYYEKRYERRIYIAQKEFDKKHTREAARELAKEIDSFCRSGILDKKIEGEFRQKYIELMEYMIYHLKVDDEDMKLELLKVYVEEKDYGAYDRLFHQLPVGAMWTSKFLEIEAKMKVQKGEFEAVHVLMEQAVKKGIVFEGDLKSQCEFWTK